uniref:MPN domain-containing protein n=1 Tax=OCS116 cluster bacterium TaxID=2030921 RepID=A0A2A4Z163_9PROT
MSIPSASPKMAVKFSPYPQKVMAAGLTNKINMSDDKPHYLGHRDRLKTKFQTNGAAALADYELLELYLFRSIPRRDTKPIAKDLIAKFGNFSAVVSADYNRLIEVKGVGDAVAKDIMLINAASLRMMQNDLTDKPILSSWSALVQYCQAAMAYNSIEEFRIIFLNKHNRIIVDEVQQQGTIDHTPVYPREVIKRALELAASAIVLVHNHPSGDPTPSPGDIKMTEQIIEAGKPIGVAVHDHLIISKDGHASFKQLGLI